MKKLALGLLLVALIFLFFVLQYNRKHSEAFWTSPGTLVQLQTSHVPTEEDVFEMVRERRRIHRDLVDLTGSD